MSDFIPPVASQKNQLYTEIKVTDLEAMQSEITRIKSVLSSDEEQIKALVNRNAALVEAAVLRHHLDEIENQRLKTLHSKALAMKGAGGGGSWSDS